jgi:hypothetical protein
MPRRNRKSPQKASKRRSPPNPANVVVSRPRVPRPVTGAVPRVYGSEQVCSLTDPFCKHALSAKYMDMSSTRSLPYSSHLRTTITTGVQGTGALLFTPNYFYQPYQVGAFAGATVYNFGTAMTAGPSLVASAYRITSMGVIVRSVVAPLSASGMVRVRGYANKTATNLGTIDTGNYNCDFYEDIPIYNCKELAIVAKRLDPTCENWRTPSETTPSTAVTAWISPGWGAFCVSVDGAVVSTTVLDVEIILHWEIQLDDTDVTAQLATQAIPYNPVVKQATDMVSSTSKNIFQGGIRMVGTYIQQKALSALGTLLFKNPVAGAAFGKAANLAITVD